jgi:hypothetical protein
MDDLTFVVSEVPQPTVINLSEMLLLVNGSLVETRKSHRSDKAPPRSIVAN